MSDIVKDLIRELDAAAAIQERYSEEIAALRARVQEYEALCEDILHGPCANVTFKQYQAHLSKRAAELLKDAK